MANTRYSFTKAVARLAYLPAFKQASEIQGWDWEKLFTKKSTSSATEHIFSYAPLPNAVATGELEEIYYANLAELAATTFTVNKWTLATVFSHELQKDNKHLPDLMKEAGSFMGDSHSFVRDISAATPFNRAFNSSYPMWDGTELCGAHTTQSGDTFTNELTAASIGPDSIWLMVNHFETSMLNQQGQYVRDTPKYLIAHPSKRKLVEVALESSLESGTMDNDKNILKGRGLIPIYCRYLTTSTNWFIAGSKFKSDALWFTREGVTTAMEDDFDLMGSKLRTHQRYAYGIRDHSHIVGNQGA